jgi:hypothetical protein
LVPCRDTFLEKAAEKYIAVAEARHLNPESLKKVREAIGRLFLGFGTKRASGC